MVQRKLAAILAADVVGYSRLMEADEAATLTALKERRKKILEPLVSKHHGRIVKLMGDGALVEFGSAVEAVQCAVDLQEEMSKANEGLPSDEAILLRIGVNLGDVVVEGGDLFGNGVNVAARLEALANPGGICISGSVYDQVRRKLRFSAEKLGPQNLKNISDPVAVYSIWPSQPTQQKLVSSEPRSEPKITIVVLPFNDVSGDPETALFADGLAEDIIIGLSRIKSLLVIDRNSSFTFKGRAVNVAQVSRELDVRYVIEGSIRRAENHVRVSAQLIDAQKASHVWAERYDRVFRSPFELQDEIANSVVATTQQQLYITEGRSAILRHDRANTELWSLMQRSWARLHDLTKEAIDESGQMAQRALAMDGNNGRANFLAGCALYHQALMLFCDEPQRTMDQAKELIERSISLDETDEHAHWILGNICWWQGDIGRSIAEYERSLEINPNWSAGLADLGEALCYAGRVSAGLTALERAIRMNPKDPSIFFRFVSMAAGHYFAGHFSEAEEWARKAVQRGRQYYLGHVFLIAALVRLNRLDDASAAKAELIRQISDFTTPTLRHIAFRPADLDHLLTDLSVVGIH